MTNFGKPIRFMADFSLLAYLGLATQYSKTKFFSFVKQDNAEALYEKLLDLDELVENGDIELIIPYTVVQELKQRKVNPYTTENRAIEMAQKEILKSSLNIYTHNHENTKYVFSPGDYIPLYSLHAEAIANLYSEMPKHPFNIALSYNLREKPFLFYNENVSYYAVKMAEATMLGLDLLTLHHHFFSQYPVDVTEEIEQINQEAFGSSSKPISLDEVLELMYDKNLQNDYRKKQINNPILTNVDLLTFHEFKNETRKQAQIKKENFQIITRRTLFLKYLDKPLNVPEANRYQKPKLQNKKSFNTKIKFDLNSPNANQILKDYFKNNKEDEIEKF